MCFNKEETDQESMETKQRSCPVCNLPLEAVMMHQMVVDRCAGCKGIFFDSGELQSISTLVKLLTAVELDEPDIDSLSSRERERTMHCPHDGNDMDKEELAGLVIDICSICGGIWLDDGEIAALKVADLHILEHLSLYERLAK